MDALEKLRQLEETLSVRDSIISNVFKLVPAMLFVVAGDTFKFATRYACEVLGYSHDELTSQPWLTWIHEEDAERSLQMVEKAKAGGWVEWDDVFVNRYRTGHGTVVTLAWRGSATDASGNSYCYVEVLNEEDLDE